MNRTSRLRYVARMPGPVVTSERAPAVSARIAIAAAMLGLLAFYCLSAALAGPPEQAWIKPGAGQSLLLDIANNNGRWVVVGERGHVLISDDAESWTQVRVPTRAMLTAVDLYGQGTGFAVGHDATIIRTRDNGETWERVYGNPEGQAPFLDVVIADAERVIAVGAYGLYAETNDGGESWVEHVLEPREPGQDVGARQSGEEEFFYDFHLNDIEIADSGRWYIAAEAGAVYRSDDRGESWLSLPSPYEGSFFGVLPMAGESLLLFGLQGRLYRSDDAGASWRRFDTGTDATLSNGLRLDDGTALITGYAGIVLKQVGAEGSLTRVRLKNRPALSAAYRLDNGDLVSVGEGGIRRWSAETISGR